MSFTISVLYQFQFHERKTAAPAVKLKGTEHCIGLCKIYRRAVMEKIGMAKNRCKPVPGDAYNSLAKHHALS